MTLAEKEACAGQSPATISLFMEGCRAKRRISDAAIQSGKPRGLNIEPHGGVWETLAGHDRKSRIEHRDLGEGAGVGVEGANW